MRNISVGTFRTTDAIRAAVNNVLDNGRLSYGPYCEELESEFARLHGCRFGVLSNSGTSSLQVALQTMKELHGWSDGDGVLVPSTTFVATANIVLHNRMVPILVDVDRDTYNMSPSEIIRTYSNAAMKIERHGGAIQAIIPVHLYGQPANMEAIRDIAAPRDLKIIEDSCECVLATHHGQTVGCLGDIACFSTYVAHILTTGVGGIATTNNPQYAAKMRSLVNHGRDGIYISIDDDDGATGEWLRQVISRRFRFDSIGHSFRITELEAAIGVAQLADLPTIIQRRQKNAALLVELLEDLDHYIQLPTIAHGNTHSFMMFPIVVRNGEKLPLCEFLEVNGIETREMLRLSDQPCYHDLWNPNNYPAAQWINDGGFYIGCHQDVTEEDLAYISEKFHEYYGSAAQG